MTAALIFWAQALDNASPDHIEMHGEELSAYDTVRRQQAVALVSNVIKTGRTIFELDGVQLSVNAQHFVIEVPSAQRDRMGRTAPIVCFGARDQAADDALGAAVAAGIDGFATRIGRSLGPEHLELARKSFSDLKKKPFQRQPIGVTAIIAAGLLLLVAGYWLIFGPE